MKPRELEVVLLLKAWFVFVSCRAAACFGTWISTLEKEEMQINNPVTVDVKVHPDTDASSAHKSNHLSL
ncbi:hypothetical protein INR49_005197 [Caranx melampygus]|nr:hypothetical protein INR49_005197 [Caranx melampygus]